MKVVSVVIIVNFSTSSVWSCASGQPVWSGWEVSLKIYLMVYEWPSHGWDLLCSCHVDITDLCVSVTSNGTI